MTDGPLTDFELYYTKIGLVQVSNDVRRRILHELEDRNLSITDLSKITGKAQSTLSVHLDKMVSEDLIVVHDDPEDSRRKVYSLVSVMLACSKPPSDDAMTMAMKVLADVADDPVRTRDALARFIFLGFDGMGLSVGPMATILGAIHAMALGGKLSGANVEETVANARDYYKSMGLGDASVYSLSPLSIIIKDELPYTEDSARAIGLYATGFFCKILEDATDKPYAVVSSEVFGTECNYFRFTLEPAQKGRSLLGFEGQERSVAEHFAGRESHPQPALPHPSVTVAGCGRVPSADHESAHEHGVPVDESCPEERGDRLPSALDEDVLHTHVRELLEDGHEVDGVPARAEGLLAVPLDVAVLEGDHDGRCPLVEHLGILGGPPMGVEDDPDGVGVVVEVLEGQMGVVGDDGADPHEDRIVLAPEVLGTGLVLVGGYRHLRPVGPGDLAVGGHGAVHMNERSHCLVAPGVTVKR